MRNNYITNHGLNTTKRDTRSNLIHVVFESSVLMNAAYSSYDRVLLVNFRSGATYRYRKIPHDIMCGLMVAKHPGRYFNKHIRTEYNGVLQ
jgi:hypothetical protein